MHVSGGGFAATRQTLTACVQAETTSAARRSRQDGQALPCGAGGDCLYIIRRGFVRAALAASDGSALLGRGHLVGSRALIDGATQRTRTS
jgi:CRP-like cAMP-binding protein